MGFSEIVCLRTEGSRISFPQSRTKIVFRSRIL
jgi:hypothetical protein